jgi:alpha-1,3-rhamnosyl/mannosyltransferase
MRVAVVYHLPNPGGVTRFTHALIDGLLAIDPDLTVDYYVSDRLVELGRVDAFDETGRVRIEGIRDPLVVYSNLDDPPPVVRGRSPIHAVERVLAPWPAIHDPLQRLWVSTKEAAQRARGIPRPKGWQEWALPTQVCDALGAYDVVYLPFPYYLEPARIDAPVVATFHDLNHLYFPENFGAEGVATLDRQLRYWTERVDVAVSSTRFIRDDVEAKYPAARGRTRIVYVAPYGIAPLTEERRLAALARFHLEDRGFVIYPCNNSRHKNVLALLAAADILKRRNGSLAYPVVLTGFGTDRVGDGTSPSFAEVDAFLTESSLVLGEDVRTLGFVTDEEVDALTRSARCVVSTSLYEAGCGPALDAWQSGVPVAFSDIPPFVEQLEVLGVEAETFDPRDPESIADALARVLDDRETAFARAERSRAAIAAYSWEIAARGYREAFEDAIARRRPDGPGEALTPST